MGAIAGEELKVFRAVVVPYSVLVMDDFISFEDASLTP